MRRRHFLQLSALAAAGSVSSLLRAATANTASQGRVVVVGGGFAGSSCAMHLRGLNPRLDVTLIDPNEIYVTCPMSNSALVGLRSMKSIRTSRHGLQRVGVSYIRDSVKAIEPRHQVVLLASGKRVSYDRLVVAPGIRFLWGTPVGYDEAAARTMPHAWKAGAQTEILAAQLHAMKPGGVVAISVPSGPMRCPPGPYERASLIAGFLKQHKPRSKVLIFDGNNRIPKQDLFVDAWQQFYPGLIEWIPSTEDGTVVRVDPQKMILHTAHGAHPVAVANIIPPQAPGLLAADAGLAAAHGWCPVKPDSFESSLIENVHVIGDACIAGAMPKSASAATSQARQCALAIAAAFAGRDTPLPMLESVCYSELAPDYAIAIRGAFEVRDGEIRQAPEITATEISAPPSSWRAQQATDAESWYKTIVADTFGR